MAVEFAHGVNKSWGRRQTDGHEVVIGKSDEEISKSKKKQYPKCHNSLKKKSIIKDNCVIMTKKNEEHENRLTFRHIIKKCGNFGVVNITTTHLSQS